MNVTIPRNPFGPTPRAMPQRKPRRRIACRRVSGPSSVLPVQPVAKPPIAETPVTPSSIMSILSPSDRPIRLPEKPQRAAGLPEKMDMVAWGIPLSATPSVRLEKYLLDNGLFNAAYSDNNIFLKLLAKRILERPPSVVDRIAIGPKALKGIELAAAVLRLPSKRAAELGSAKIRRMLVQKRRLWGPLQIDAFFKASIARETDHGPESWKGGVSLFLMRGFRNQVHVVTCSQDNGGAWSRKIHGFEGGIWANANLFDIHDARLI